MKLTPEQRAAFDTNDPEILHIEYDRIVFARLCELDPELMAELDEICDVEEFWYA